MLERTRVPGEEPRGISLIEVLIALAVLGVGLAALAAVLPASTQGLQQGAQVSTATFLAEQRLEQIASAAWTAVPPNDCVGTSGAGPTSWSFDGGGAPRAPGSCDGGDTSHPDEGPSGRVDDHPPTRLANPFGGYTRRARVQPCDAPEATCGGVADPGLRRLTVRVGYVSLGRGGAEKRWVELSTLIARQ
jgi:prepilin-type N-terminal cleavage/methylation domain-containing protein